MIRQSPLHSPALQPPVNLTQLLNDHPAPEQLLELVDINVPCVCQESFFSPFMSNGNVYFFCWETKEPQRMHHSHSPVQEYLVSYNLTGCEMSPRRNITGIKQCVCSVFSYKGKVTLLGGEFHAGHFKVGLFQLPAATSAQSYSWQLVTNSKRTIHNLDPNNCICVEYECKVVVVTISNKPRSSPQIFFHVYSPDDENEVYWKNASVYLTNSPKQVSHRKCQIQSCIVLSKNTYFALNINNVVHIYQTDLTTLFGSTQPVLPPPTRVVKHDLSILKSFLAVVGEEIIVINVKTVDSKTLVEFKLLRSSSSSTYLFLSTVKIITAAVLPDAKNGIVAYHDAQANSCKLKTLSDCH